MTDLKPKKPEVKKLRLPEMPDEFALWSTTTHDVERTEQGHHQSPSFATWDEGDGSVSLRSGNTCLDLTKQEAEAIVISWLKRNRKEWFE